MTAPAAYRIHEKGHDTVLKQYEIWDMHGHIFPEKIAGKAAQAIGDFYDIPMRYSGDSARILESGARIGVARQLVCSSATAPAQVHSINDFIAAQCKEHPRFIGLCALHPDMDNPDAELTRIRQLGLVGVKLHPDFQQFAIDSPRAVELYRVIAAHGLPVLFHTGDIRFEYSSPRRLANAMDKVPELVAIAAHFGGYTEWDIVPEYLNRPNVWFDTCSTLMMMEPVRAVQMIRTLGSERFFFGVDFPMWDHKEELDRFLALPLTERERADILSENAKRFWKQLGLAV